MGSQPRHSTGRRAGVRLTPVPLRPHCAPSSSESYEQIRAGIDAELRRLHKTNALLIATQFAANHDAKFDVSDALAAIIESIEQTIATLDLLALETTP